MKYLLLLSFALPILASGQVRMSDLITKCGLSYEMAGRDPFIDPNGLSGANE